MKALAAILVEQNQPLALEDIEIPPVGVAQVLVKVLCSGICGSQLGEIDGVKGPDRFLPHLLGHEGTGIVMEVGPGVRTVKPGDKVVLHWRKGAGLESLPPSYASRLGRVNAGWVTTFNEYAVVSENRVTAIPKEFNSEMAALFGCAITTGFGVVNNDAGVKIGESVVVFGAGGVGLSVVQGAALAGANPIVAIDLHDNRLALARKLGATHIINSSRADAEVQIRDAVGAAGVDVAVECTGNVQVIQAAYWITSDRGRTVLVGVPPKGGDATISTLPLHFEKRLVGSHGGQCRPHVDIPNYIRLCAAGKLDLSLHIDRRFGLTQINDAIAEIRRGAIAGRAMVTIAAE